MMFRSLFERKSGVVANVAASLRYACVKTVGQIACATLVAIMMNGAFVRSSTAQMAALPQPTFTLRDLNGVDFLSLNAYFELTDTSIGSKEHPLVHTSQPGPDYFDPLSDAFNANLVWMSGTRASCSPSQPVYIRVYLGNKAEYFQGCFTYLPPFESGSTLVFNANGTYSYTTRDGTVVIFAGSPQGQQIYNPQQINYPDGRVLTYGYFNDGSGAPLLKSVTRSDGLQLKYQYSKLASGAYAISSVIAINNAYEYCSPTAVTCSLSQAWPTASYSRTTTSGNAGILTVTDSGNRVTSYTSDTNGRVTGIKLPSSASANNLTYEYCDSNCPQYNFEGPYGVQYQNYVLKVTRDGQVWNYSGNPNTGTTNNGTCDLATYQSTNPVGAVRSVALANCFNTVGGFAPPQLYLNTFTNEDGVQANGPDFPYIANAVMPEGNQTQYTWDARGNLTQEKKIPKSGSPLYQPTLSANYDTTCTNTLTCNKPHWVKDALQNETDYTYDPNHGGVLTVTSPADSNGIRPQTRYTYTQQYAWVLNASGSYVQSAAPIWVLSTESFCRTSAATASGCTVAGDQVVKTYYYGPNSGPNNLFLRGFSVTADGTTHRTCYGYDRMGHRISETEPAAGLASCP